MHTAVVERHLHVHEFDRHAAWRRRPSTDECQHAVAAGDLGRHLRAGPGGYTRQHLHVWSKHVTERRDTRQASEVAVVRRYAERLRDVGQLVPNCALLARRTRGEGHRDNDETTASQNRSFPTMRRRFTRPRSWFSIFIDRLSPTTKNSPGARSTGAIFHCARRTTVGSIRTSWFTVTAPATISTRSPGIPTIRFT